MYWGIDLGGTKIEGMVMTDRHPDSVIARHRIDTEAKGGYEHILSRIKLLVDHLIEMTGYRPSALGIGTPGTIDPTSGLLKNSNTLCLNGQPVNKDLEKLLGIKIAMANDANCFALAEYHLGVVHSKLPDARVMFGVIMGTGVGGGVVVDGKIIGGHHGIGGEWGHMFLDESGEDCYCGRHGCVETIISGPALQRYYTKLTGQQKKLVDILATPEDPYTIEIKNRLIHFFGKGLGQIINVLDPDVIVLGGGLAHIDFLYTDGIASVAKNIFNPTLSTPILPPSLGDSAGVFGAAILIGD
ncbi:MAG: ROK family protein [Saprospiraceae bacterium]|uniref:ROK family protein n=1 Tax=Candidatus Opimibacter skivensis TaxID=2982028 RepID=A0A9D7SX98_9BACT|nr:ROK family protein [Candidatus Opimibacter skivensis]